MDQPGKLAEHLIKTLGDADYNTAHTALEIAKLLLLHRNAEMRAFVSDPTCAPIGSNERSTG